MQPYEMTRDLIVAARELGFESLNVDLIYGLPYQTAETFQATIDQVLTLAARPRGDVQLRPRAVAQEAAGLVSSASARRTKRNSASSARDSRNFSAPAISTSEWITSRGPATSSPRRSRIARCTAISRDTPPKPGADLYGMGVSAISSIGEAYAQNRREVPAYQEAVASRGIATMRGYRLSPDDVHPPRRDRPPALPHRDSQARNRARIFDFLRRIFRRGTRAARRTARRRPGRFSTPGEIRVTPLGRIFIRNVAMVFDRYLHEQQMDQRPLFSKTL